MSHLRNLLIAATAIIALGAGLLLAAPDEPTPGEELREPGETSETTAKLTPKEMRESAGKIMEEIRDMLGRLVELRKLARQSQDVLKLNCVNDKMLLFKQVVNIAEDAQTSLVESIAMGDAAARYHHYGQVVLSKERAENLRSDAEGCIGAEVDFLGPTRTTVDGPDIAELDRLYNWFDLDDPKYATPFN